MGIFPNVRDVIGKISQFVARCREEVVFFFVDCALREIEAAEPALERSLEFREPKLLVSIARFRIAIAALYVAIAEAVSK